MAARKYVYYGEVERFGYLLQCIGFTEKEVKDSLIEEYVKTYKQNEGVDPREAYEMMQNWDDTYEMDAEYYEDFLDALFIDKVELGKVEWR